MLRENTGGYGNIREIRAIRDRREKAKKTGSRLKAGMTKERGLQRNGRDDKNTYNSRLFQRMRAAKVR